MQEVFKKPYEISVWEDILVPATETKPSYYKEKKIAVIGSSKFMPDVPNRAYDPILTQNINGEITLTFSLAYKYYDPGVGEVVTNPFASYLVNERKIKLFYNGDWYDFVIKECEEDSESMVFNYTARNLFVQELSKVGYDVELDMELGNNQGTITELAKTVLEGTDWVVDEENSDLLQQYIREPLYNVTVTSGFSAKNLKTGESASIAAEETIWVFYSYIANKDGTNLQFLRANEVGSFAEDSNGVYVGTNYRFEGAPAITDSEIEGIGTIGQIYAAHQGYRLVYKQSTTYDPVMKWTVNRYSADFGDGDTEEVYQYTDYEYTTSDIVKPLITNGSNFNVYEDGSLQGWIGGLGASYVESGELEFETSKDWWDRRYSGSYFKKEDVDDSIIYTFSFIKDNVTYTTQSRFFWGARATIIDDNSIYIDGTPNQGDITSWRVTYPKDFTLESVSYSYETSVPETVPVDITTYPEISITTNITKITNFAKINGYLETKFTNANSYLYNSGFEDNTSIINRVIMGEEYLLRWRGGYSDEKHGTLTALNGQTPIRARVAKYETYIPENGYYYKDKLVKDTPVKRILENGVILDFTGSFDKANNIISNGTFDSDYSNYRVNTVVQEPSTRYVYITETDPTEYIWDSEQKKYVQKEGRTDFLDYYYTTATAQQSVSADEFKMGDVKLGVFLYVEGDLVNKWVYINDIQITRLYLDGSDPPKPILIGNLPEAHSLQTDYYYLKPFEGAQADQINQYHSAEDLAAELGIDVSAITPIYNEDSEKILSVSESKSNCFNILQTLCETFECWLELHVDHDDEGYLKTNSDGAPIKLVRFHEYAGKDNWAGFKYGINLETIQRNIVSDEFVTKLIVPSTTSDYTLSGQLAIEDAKSNPSLENYILDFSYYQKKRLIANVDESNEDLYNFYQEVSAINKQIQEASKTYVDIEASLTKVRSQRNVYSELIDKAKEDYQKARNKFIDLTGMDYDTYVEQQEEDNKIEDENIADVVGRIYADCSTINNYGGLLTILDEEYKKLMLQCYGPKEYSLVVTTINPSVGVENDFGTTKVVLNDYFDGVRFTVYKDRLSEQDVTTPNERVFNYTHQYDYIRLDNFDENYFITYTINNQKQYGTQGTIIKISAENNGKTTRIKLAPKQSYKDNYPPQQKILEDLYAQKAEILKNFYKKYSRFIQEGTWSSTDYIDPELYYLDALQVSRVSAQPKVEYTIKVIEVSEIEGLQNYDYEVGDKTFIEDVEFFGYKYDGVVENGDDEWNGTYSDVLTPAREEVIVSEAQWHLDAPEENEITIQNYKDQFEDLFQRLTATVQSVQYNEPMYSRMASVLDANGTINQSTLLSSLNAVAGQQFNLAADGSVYVDNGLVMQSLTGGANMVKIDSEGIHVSKDAGITWDNAVNSNGLNTNKLTIGEINTQNVLLMDGDNPSFRWDKNGISAYGLSDNDPDNPYDLKTFVRFDRYGLYGIQNNPDFVATSLDEIQDNANFGVTWDGFFIKNKYRNGYVAITSEDDFLIVGDTTATFVVQEQKTAEMKLEEEGENNG